MEEYEMQLFNFHSRAVYATIKNIISESIHCTIQKLCDTIGKTYKLNSENAEVLKENRNMLEKAYYKEAVPHLKTIENIVNNYIAVPSNVLLEEDRCQRTQYSEVEFENLKRRLEDLQQRAKRATILNAALKEELQILDELPVSEESVNEMYNIIEKGLKCPDINDKMCRLVEDYKQFSTSMFGAVPITEKSKYNTVDNLKCKDFDLNDL